MGSAEAESWRRCRSSRVEEMAEALPVWCGRDARVPGWAAALRLTGTPTRKTQKKTYIRNTAEAQRTPAQKRSSRSFPIMP